MINRQIVFELDGWTLEEAGLARQGFPYMIVRHACPPYDHDGRELIVPRVHVYVDVDQRCWRCTTPIPEGITALYLLHEWDNL